MFQRDVLIYLKQNRLYTFIDDSEIVQDDGQKVQQIRDTETL